MAWAWGPWPGTELRPRPTEPRAEGTALWAWPPPSHTVTLTLHARLTVSSARASRPQGKQPRQALSSTPEPTSSHPALLGLRQLRQRLQDRQAAAEPAGRRSCREEASAFGGRLSAQPQGSALCCALPLRRCVCGNSSRVQHKGEVARTRTQCNARSPPLPAGTTPAATAWLLAWTSMCRSGQSGMASDSRCSSTSMPASLPRVGAGPRQGRSGQARAGRTQHSKQKQRALCMTRVPTCQPVGTGRQADRQARAGRQAYKGAPRGGVRQRPDPLGRRQGSVLHPAAGFGLDRKSVV